MVEFILILAAPVVGGLIYGVERVLRARMQNRLGPPVFQPFYDMCKLFDKKPFIINNYHVVFAMIHFITLWAVVAFIIIGDNLLYIIFLHLLASLFLVIAGYSVNSVYSHIGSNRELLSIVAYEPVLILVAVGFYMVNGSFDISLIRENGSSLFSMILLFISFLTIIPIKLKKSPFDVTEAHQEIVGGVEIEYSGVFFEILYTAKWLEYVFIYLILLLFAGDSILTAVILFFTVFIGINLVDNSTARVKTEDMVKLVLSIAITLSIVNLLGLAYV